MEGGLLQAAPVMPHPPCWLRFKKKLTDLPAVKRYRSDLALAFRREESGYDVLVIPRFKFRYEEGGRRPAPRLFMSRFAFAAGFKGKSPAIRSPNRFSLDGDEIFEPFALKSDVPADAFDLRANIKAEEIILFYYGAIEFWELHPDLSRQITKKFMGLSCRLYLQHPVQINEKVEAVSGYAVGTKGRIRYIDGDSCTVEVEGEDEGKEVDLIHLRRWFQAGDHVRVHWSEREEWRGALGIVLMVEDELVTVYKDEANPNVSHLTATTPCF